MVTFILIFKVGFVIFLWLRHSHTSSNVHLHIWATADNHIPFNLLMCRPGSSLAGVACHAQRETRQRDTCLWSSKWSVTTVHLGNSSWARAVIQGWRQGGRCDNVRWTGLINHRVVTLALVSVYVSTNWNPTGTRLRQTCTLGPPTISSRWGEFRCLASIGYLQLAVLSLPAEAKSHGHV